MRWSMQTEQLVDGANQFVFIWTQRSIINFIAYQASHRETFFKLVHVIRPIKKPLQECSKPVA